MAFGAVRLLASAPRSAPRMWTLPEPFNNTSWQLPRSGLSLFLCHGEGNKTDGYLYRRSSQVASDPSFDLLVAWQLALSEIHPAGTQQCLHRLVRSHAHVADPCIKSWPRGLQGVPAIS